MALQNVTVEEQCLTVAEICRFQLLSTLIFLQINVDTLGHQKRLSSFSDVALAFVKN